MLASVHSAAFLRVTVAWGTLGALGFAGFAANAARRFSVNLFIMAATLVALAAATLLLVPAGGALGAGWALCTGMAARFALSLGAALRL